MLTVECTCKPGELYGDEVGTPEFFTDPEKARLRLLQHVVAGHLYFGVHLNGGHIPWNKLKHLLRKVALAQRQERQP